MIDLKKILKDTQYSSERIDGVLRKSDESGWVKTGFIEWAKGIYIYPMDLYKGGKKIVGFRFSN